MEIDSRTHSHLQQLEAESIQIFRGAAEEFHNPVTLYSIGKDASVMLRLALKAFAPGRLRFAWMQIDTTWQFKEMITFRAKNDILKYREIFDQHEMLVHHADTQIQGMARIFDFYLLAMDVNFAGVGCVKAIKDRH